MATYLKNEELYREFVRAYLAQDMDAESFVKKFINQWKADRDDQWAEINSGKKYSEEESGFCEALDQIFTACDCYDPEPEERHEINNTQLMSEVSQLTIKRWGTI